jgi:hypothetical protein
MHFPACLTPDVKLLMQQFNHELDELFSEQLAELELFNSKRPLQALLEVLRDVDALDEWGLSVHEDLMPVTLPFQLRQIKSRAERE